jgi:hypothetical protein
MRSSALAALVLFAITTPSAAQDMPHSMVPEVVGEVSDVESALTLPSRRRRGNGGPRSVEGRDAFALLRVEPKINRRER